MSDYIKFFDERINKELAINPAYARCMDDYKRCKDYVKYFKKAYPRLVRYIAGSITPATILKQNWSQQLAESKDKEINQGEYMTRYYWYDKRQKKLWEEKLETTKLYYAEVEQFVMTELDQVVTLEHIERHTARRMAIIEKHVGKKVICENIDTPELRDLIDDLISEKNTKLVGFKAFLKDVLYEDIEYSKVLTRGSTNTTLAVIEGIKEIAVKKNRKV